MIVPWTYTQHRFANRAAYLAMRAALGWSEALPDGVNGAEIGTLYANPPDDVTPAAALSGWHADFAWRGVGMAEGLSASVVTPASPRHRWA